jgi:hypothetical protein
MSQIDVWPAGSPYRGRSGKVTVDARGVQDLQVQYRHLRAHLTAGHARMTLVHAYQAGLGQARRRLWDLQKEFGG